MYTLNFQCPIYKRVGDGGRTFAIRTDKDWNKLPVELKRITTVRNFRKKMYKDILAKQKETDLFISDI